MLGVLLIDFYMFRPYFLTFFGPERIPPEAGTHAHESPGSDDLAAGDAGLSARRPWRLYFEWTHGLGRVPGRDAVAGVPVATGRQAAVESAEAFGHRYR